jgi:hypothetical protein
MPTPASFAPLPATRSARFFLLCGFVAKMFTDAGLPVEWLSHSLS